MHEEISSMMTNKTWKLVFKPPKARLIGSKWIYKVKEAPNPYDLPGYKARLVAKGFTQREGEDYSEIFAPVVKYKTMRLMLAYASVYNLEVDQMDVKTAFCMEILKKQYIWLNLEVMKISLNLIMFVSY